MGLDKAHDDLDQYQFGVTKRSLMTELQKLIANDMWG